MDIVRMIYIYLTKYKITSMRDTDEKREKLTDDLSASIGAMRSCVDPRGISLFSHTVCDI